MNNRTSVEFNILRNDLGSVSSGQPTARPQLVTALAMLLLATDPASAANSNLGASTAPPFRVADQRETKDRRTKAVQSALARLRRFAKFAPDWDGEGAPAPGGPAINSALEFLIKLQPWHPLPMATLDRDGTPVVEFEEPSTGYFGSLRYLSKDDIELYSQNAEEDSEFFAGKIDSPDTLRFLREKMNLSIF